MIRPLVLAALAVLAACATPRERIADRLVAAGVEPLMAACLGRELDERLTIAELRALGRAVEPVARRVEGRRVNAADVAEAAARIGDARIVAAVGASGLRCALSR